MSSWRPLVQAAVDGQLDQHGLAHLGRTWADLEAVAALFAATAEEVDQGRHLPTASLRRSAETVRAVVERAAVASIDAVGRSLGPRPLVADPAHARSSRWYERRKYALTLAALPRPRYQRAFEPGCSIGVLTEQLAGRVDELVAWELHPGTASRTAVRTDHLSQVSVEAAAIPERWPDGAFDLIVLSEVGYYFEDDALARLVRRLDVALAPEGDLVAVHWDGPTDYPHTAAEVHDALARVDGLEPWVAHRDQGFRLDVWRRG